MDTLYIDIYYLNYYSYWLSQWYILRLIDLHKFNILEMTIAWYI